MIILSEAKSEDIEDIYINLNYNYVRKYYKFNEDIEKKKYINWYKFLLNSLYHKIFIIRDLKNDFLGCVKFDIKKNLNSAEVSIYLIESTRGRGYSTNILKVAIDELKFKYPKLEEVEAYILEENEKSIYCFERAGFIYNCEKKNKGIKYKLYIKNIESKEGEN